MNEPVKIKTVETVNVREAARTAVQGAESVNDATDRLLAMARGDASLMEAMMQPYARIAARTHVRYEMRDKRAKIWREQTVQPANDRVGALVRSNMAMLMDFPLPGGKPLRDATRDEVSDAANSYRKQAVDMAQKSAWLKLVAENVPKGKTVGETLDELSLALFKEKTKNG